MLPPSHAHVPIDEFETNLRWYINQVLQHEGWRSTKVLLLTPPPISVRVAEAHDNDEENELDLGPATNSAIEELRKTASQGRGHLTWASKRKYAERIMAIVQSFESQHNVHVLDVWTILTKKALEEAQREWKEGQLPGCGLPSATNFPEGWFSDGLHFGSLVGHIEHPESNQH